METPSGTSHASVDLARQLPVRGCAAPRYARPEPKLWNKEKTNARKRFAESVNVLRLACQVLIDFEPGIKGLGYSRAQRRKRCSPPDVPDGAPRAENARVDTYISLSGPAFRFSDTMMNQAEVDSRNGIGGFPAAGFSWTFTSDLSRSFATGARPRRI